MSTVTGGPQPTYVRYGEHTTSVPPGAGVVVLKPGLGRLCKILITAAGDGVGAAVFYDNAATPTGMIIGYVPATVTVGTIIDCNMPFLKGLVVNQVGNGPAFTVSFN